MEDENTLVKKLIFSRHAVAIVAKHSVEEGTEGDNSVDIHYRVFLEQDLKDRYHKNNVCHSHHDEAHRLNDHLNQRQNKYGDLMND